MFDDAEAANVNDLTAFREPMCGKVPHSREVSSCAYASNEELGQLVKNVNCKADILLTNPKCY